MTARVARAPWSELVVVCGKCARKAGHKGFRKALKAALRQADSKVKFRVVDVGCLDLCPKNRVTFATGRNLAAARLSVVAADDVTAAAEAILREGRADSDTQLLSIDRPRPQP